MPFLLFALGCVPLLAAQILTQRQEAKPPGKAAVVAAADDQAIGGIAEAWRNAYNRGDASKVASLYSENGY